MNNEKLRMKKIKYSWEICWFGRKKPSWREADDNWYDVVKLFFMFMPPPSSQKSLRTYKLVQTRIISSTQIRKVFLELIVSLTFKIIKSCCYLHGLWGETWFSEHIYHSTSSFISMNNAIKVITTFFINSVDNFWDTL